MEEDTPPIEEEQMTEKEAAETIHSLSTDPGMHSDLVEDQNEEVETFPQVIVEEEADDDDDVPLINLREVRTRSKSAKTSHAPPTKPPVPKKKGKKPTAATPKRKSADVGTSS